MSISDDLSNLAALCSSSAKQTLSALLALGPKPEGNIEGLLWEQQTTRLQGQLNSLTALNSKMTAASVLAGLADLADELDTIGKVAKAAQEKIKKIKNVSELLTKIARVLDLGLAVLAASAAPSPMTVAAVVAAGNAVADQFA